MSKALVNRTLTNPLNESFYFKWDSVEYEVPARSTVTLINYLAEHGAKHLAKKILLNAGRYNDVIQNDKRVAKAISFGEKQFIADAFIDRDEHIVDLDKIVKDAASPSVADNGAVKQKRAAQKLPAIGKVEVKSQKVVSEKKVEGIPPNNAPVSSEDKDRLALITEFEEMKIKKAWVNPATKDRYLELKKLLNR